MTKINFKIEMNNFEYIDERSYSLPCQFAKLAADRAQQLSLNKNTSVVLLQKHSFKSQQAYFIEIDDNKCAFVYENEIKMDDSKSPNKIEAIDHV